MCGKAQPFRERVFQFLLGLRPELGRSPKLTPQSTEGRRPSAHLVAEPLSLRSVLNAGGMPALPAVALAAEVQNGLFWRTLK